MLIDELSRKVAKELGLKEDLVTRLNRVQYKFLLDNIQSANPKGVQLIYW